MLRFMSLLFCFMFVFIVASASGHGGGGGGGGGGGDGYGSADSPSNHLPPVMPLEMKPEDILKIKTKPKNSGSSVSIKEWNEMNRKARARAKIFGKKTAREVAQEKAFDDVAREDAKVQIAKGVGYTSAAAASVVGVIATGGAAATIATITVASDGVAAAAGSLSESYNNGKSVKEAIRDATVEGVKKAAFTKFIAVAKVGGKATSAAANAASGLMYDHANNSAKNLKDN